MSDEDIEVLLCFRVEDYPIPATDSVLDNCNWCGASVWVSKSSPIVGKIICMECYSKVATPGDEIQPPTPKQLKDILRNQP
jgi:hypothetical protein